jgi:colanic acid biosynthesis glycosyl transferase WcaI
VKILIVSQYFWPENFRINDLASELVRKGNHVTVLTGIPNYPDGKVFPEFRDHPKLFNELNGIEIIRVPLLPRGKGSLRLVLNYLTFMLNASILGAWKLRGYHFDVVFVYQVSPVTVGLPGALMSKLKNAPMAMWVLDLWPDTLQAIGVVRSPRVLRWVGLLVSFIYRRCDLVLSQSRSFVPEIRRLASERQSIEYLPSWAEDVFQSLPTQPISEIPVLEGSFDVMFAGNIGEAQDFPCILAAAERLKNHKHIRWLIVGDGRMQPWVAEEVQRRGLQQQVLLLGRFPVEFMPSYYQQADALLVTLQDKPIFKMTIPGKLQSYLAAGIPVVAVLAGEGADLIRTSQAGLTSTPGSPEELANAVLTLSRMSAEQRRTLGENGRRVSHQEFDRNTILNKLEHYLIGMTLVRKVHA